MRFQILDNVKARLNLILIGLYHRLDKASNSKKVSDMCSRRKRKLALEYTRLTTGGDQ